MTGPAAKGPLHGVRVLDFSTLLPGPLAGLILAEAGAEVIKIERPGLGEEMRRHEPPFGDASASYALLNRGKRAIAVDLKAEGAVERLRPLIESAQVVIEQFRPGVMDRLGLGFEAMRAINPAIVYCAITGYGQDGPLRDVAGHDQNYLAKTGMLALGGDDTGKPVLPPGLIADIGGGALPAVVNILLALREAERTGEGAYLDIAMTDGLFAWQFWAQAETELDGRPPEGGGARLTGGSPRYRVYRTKDGKFLSAGPLEQKFWDNFCAALDVPQALRDDSRDPAATRRAVEEIVGGKTAAEIEALFEGRDVCSVIVQSMAEAMADPQFTKRGIFDRRVTAADGASLTALCPPLAPVYRDRMAAEASFPALGEGNDEFLGAECPGEKEEG